MGIKSKQDDPICPIGSKTKVFLAMCIYFFCTLSDTCAGNLSIVEVLLNW